MFVGVVCVFRYSCLFAPSVALCLCRYFIPRLLLLFVFRCWLLCELKRLKEEFHTWRMCQIPLLPKVGEGGSGWRAIEARGGVGGGERWA